MLGISSLYFYLVTANAACIIARMRCLQLILLAGIYLPALIWLARRKQSPESSLTLTIIFRVTGVNSIDCFII